MKRKIIVIILCAIMSISGTISIYADEDTTDTEKKLKECISVPDHMLPNTVIEYISEDEYKILQGGKLNKSEDEYKIFQGGELNRRAEFDSVYEWARADLLRKENIDINKITFKKCETPTPSKGMIVKYADDGRISSINSTNPNSKAKAGNGECRNCHLAFVKGSPEYKSNYMWGGKNGNNNVLYAGKKVIYGYGRFTNYTDKTGQADHTLKKGDVATRGHVDNPKVGTLITCEAPYKR